ncbi:hypothetical protein LCGC14_0556240 [marine sediment metagenome]|uniref:Uncharacterized protein n=1 Tax=marine sediment metagenome TaxID=412755 RepID=A0A0F9U9L9_9ZZZZ
MLKNKKMENSIVQDSERWYGRIFKEKKVNILKFESEIKSLGVKNVVISETITLDKVPEVLTFYIKPNFYSSLDEMGNGRNMGIERDAHRNSYRPFYDYLVSLSGSSSFRFYNGLRDGSFDKMVILKADHEGKSFEIGVYIPDRNIVVSFLSLNLSGWATEEKNEYLTVFLDFFKKAFKDKNVKEVNTFDIRKKILITCYSVDIDNKIAENTCMLSETENNLESYKGHLINSYRTIRINKDTISSLKNLKDNVEKGLLDQIEVIKGLRFVTDAVLTDEGIKVTLEMIKINVGKESVEMGIYDVLITSRDLKITNRSPVEYGGAIYHSCHIMGDGICYGDKEDVVLELLGKLELKKLIHFIYIYLRTYNPEDTYLSMNFWMSGKKNGGKVPEDIIKKDQDAELYVCGDCDNSFLANDFNFDLDLCLGCFRLLNENNERSNNVENVIGDFSRAVENNIPNTTEGVSQ